MKIVLISLVTIALIAGALSGFIMLASRDGGEGDGGAPGPDIYDGIDDVKDDEEMEGPDENPYDNEDPVIENNNTDNNNGNVSEDPDDPDKNISVPDNSPDEGIDGNDTIPDEPECNKTIDNGTDPEPIDTEDPADNETEKTDNSTKDDTGSGNETEDDQENNSPYLYTGKIRIEGFGTFAFNPWEVRTTRPDIFAGGHFSLFDILVYLDHKGTIDLDYQFNESMDTFQINSINASVNWWYRAYYSGGWQESNAWRMDLYPYKDNTTITVYQEDDWMIERVFESFRTQVERRDVNKGKIIIPRVTIQAPSGTLEFNNVEVTAHNLRNDSFQDGVITAIDVIMSLGDQGLIIYELKWYESIAGSDPVKNYWVEAINDDAAHGTCGFVYETGEEKMGGHNHIHIPSDQRILTSPEYELFFWICL